MDTNCVIAKVKIGDWYVCIEECADKSRNELYDRTFGCYKYDSSGNAINEYFGSLIEAIEFAQAFSGSLYPNGWDIVERMAVMAQEFYKKEGLIS